MSCLSQGLFALRVWMLPSGSDEFRGAGGLVTRRAPLRASAAKLEEQPVELPLASPRRAASMS
eukprot:3920859-Pyramimonas_sp.AAC.1